VVKPYEVIHVKASRMSIIPPLSMLLAIIASSFAAAQSTTSSIMASAWKAFSNGAPVARIQLTGRVTTYAGESSDTGSIIASASIDTSVSIQRSLSAGSSSEARSQSNGSFQCVWTGTDGVQHESPAHNCWQNISWLAPSLSAQYSMLPSNVGVSYIGHETLGSVAVEHIQFQTIFGDANTPTAITSLVQKVSTADLYLDSTTLLPVVLRYSIHADDDVNTSIAVEAHYSNYMQSSGLTVPMHVEKTLNGALQEVIDVSGFSAS
jgi:hypothetical protein